MSRISFENYGRNTKEMGSKGSPTVIAGRYETQLEFERYIFFDVIGVDDPSLSNTREDSKYRIVTESHEQGTVQSYFDLDIVHNLLGKMFEVVEFYNIKKYCKLQKTLASRYYVIAKKI